MGGRLSGPFNKLIPGSIILYLGFYIFFNIYFKNLNSGSVLKILSFNNFVHLFVASVLITGERMNFFPVYLSTSIFFHK